MFLVLRKAVEVDPVEWVLVAAQVLLRFGVLGHGFLRAMFVTRQVSCATTFSEDDRHLRVDWVEYENLRDLQIRNKPSECSTALPSQSDIKFRNQRGLTGNSKTKLKYTRWFVDRRGVVHVALHVARRQPKTSYSPRTAC